jgi:hypothetical protein
MKKTLFLIISVLTFIYAKSIYSQTTNLQKSVQYSAETGIYLSNGQTTFWQQANQYGTVPDKSPYLTAQGSLQIDYKNDTIKNHKRLLGWGWAVNAIANAATASKVILPEAYLKAHIGLFEIWGGWPGQTHQILVIFFR